MNCPKCGSPIAENSTFCVHCGSAVAAAPAAAPAYQQPAAPAYQQPAAPNYQQPYGAPTGYGQPNGYGAPYGAPTGYGAPYGQPARPARAPRRTLEGVPMNFFDMLVNWLMYALGGICVLIGVFYICRWNFAPAIKEILKEEYIREAAELNGLLAMNIIFGILMILAGGAWVGLRFMLDSYHKDAPKFTCLMFLVTGGIVFLYRIISQAILAGKMNAGASDGVFTAYDGIMAGLFFFLLCGVAFYEVGRYFGRRAALFR